MNIDQAKQLIAGDILNPNVEHENSMIDIQAFPGSFSTVSVKVFPKGIYNSDGTLLRYRVTSVKTWKRSPERIEIKAKRGLYGYVTLNEETIKFVCKGN